jgi:tetratricopeptide (TPR) repeat protein
MNENFPNLSPEDRPIQFNKQSQSSFNNKMNEVLSQQTNRSEQSTQTFNSRPVSQQSRPIGENKRNQSKLESIAYYIFLITAFLTPLAFLPTPYMSLGLVKTVIIAVGILASAICYGLVILKEKTLTLPTKSIFWTSILLVISLLTSTFLSNHASKALFGQGFEVGTAGFFIVLFVAALVAYECIRRDRNRVFTFFSFMGLVYIILFLLELLRIIFGPTALSFSILSNVTSTILGGWFDFGVLSLFILIVLVCALLLLPLSGRTKIIYGIVAIVALFMSLIANPTVAWVGAAFVFAIMIIAIYHFRSSKPELGKWKSFISRISWLPVILCLISLIIIWKGATLAGPMIQATNTQYSELSLPWQITTDVVSGTIKNYPLFGVGPNHFTQAFTIFKPVTLNLSNAWNVEFSSGFGLIPTFIATQGSIGAVLWILLLVFIGILATRLLKNLPSDPQMKFMALSSCLSTILLLINMILYVPSQAIILLTFVVLGIFVAITIHAKMSLPIIINPVSKIKQRIFSLALIVAIVLAIIGGLIYMKKFVAFSYFASGVKKINVSQDYKSAYIDFEKALSFENSDVYLQALSENDRLEASQMISSATSTPSTEFTKAIGDIINDGIKMARLAIAYDPTNYYNYVSEARISDLAASIKMANAYDNSVRAYTNAISLNPLNPSLYVNLAQVQATNSKYDDALKTIGAALQVKNNYLDAVYLLSQIQTAQGNLRDAIISTQVATRMNPQSPLLFFQLGLLQYSSKNYASSTEALEQAIKLTPEYANAKYFLGLSYVRMNRIAEAIAIFTDLSKANPDNKEVSFILTNLEEGKSPFADAKPPVTPTPEKRPALPVKEKDNK